MKLQKTRYSFGCGFCGAGNRIYANVVNAMRASNKHSCKSKMITVYQLSYYEGYSKPVERKLVQVA
jgi:hypothetical protein